MPEPTMLPATRAVAPNSPTEPWWAATRGGSGRSLVSAAAMRCPPTEPRASGRREHRRRRPPFGRLELDPHLHADGKPVRRHVHEVGQHSRAFVQGHIADGVGAGRRAVHDRVGVDHTLAGALLPDRFAGRAERADGPRVPVGLLAIYAALDQEAAFLRRIPEGLRLDVDHRRGDRPGHRGVRIAWFRHAQASRSRITVAEPWRVPSEPPVPCAMARSQFFTCTFGCASPRSWRTASITLVMPPRLRSEER